MFWTTAAHAMGTTGQSAAGAEGAFASMAPLLLMFGVFYFLLIRPQQKRAKEHKQMLSNLKRGDKVITAGGLYGKILEANDDTLVLDLGDSKVTVGRAFVSGFAGTPPAAQAKNDKNSKKEKAEQAAKAEKKETAENADASQDETK